MTAPDPFALGGWQVPAFTPTRPKNAADLWKEHGDLVAQVNHWLGRGDVDELEVEAMINRELAIEDEIAGQVATDKAGLIAQVHLLVHYHQDFEWGQWGDDLARKLIAGIAILGATDEADKGGAK